MSQQIISMDKIQRKTEVRPAHHILVLERRKKQHSLFCTWFSFRTHATSKRPPLHHLHPYAALTQKSCLLIKAAIQNALCTDTLVIFILSTHLYFNLFSSSRATVRPGFLTRASQRRAKPFFPPPAGARKEVLMSV